VRKKNVIETGQQIFCPDNFSLVEKVW